MKQVGYPFDPSVRVYLQHTLGAFREAQAADFGRIRRDAELPGEDRDGPKAALLCKAYVAYSQAKTAITEADKQNPSAQPTQASAELPFADPPEFVRGAILRHNLDDLIYHAWNALYALPPHAVAKAQTEVEECSRSPNDGQ